MIKQSSNVLAKEAVRLGAIQKRKELQSLLILLRRKRLQMIVEIGTARGGTFYALCKVAEPKATLISIDMPKGPFGGGYTLKQMKTIKKYGSSRQRLFFIRRNSHLKTTLKVLKIILKGKNIDFLFIDGDHTYNGVKKDYEMYSPLVNKNGLIALHDIVHHDKFKSCQVDLFWKELKNKYETREIIFTDESTIWGNWGGIGLIMPR